MLFIEEDAEHSFLGNAVAFGMLALPTGEAIWLRKERSASYANAAGLLLRRLAKAGKSKQRKRQGK